MIIQTIISTGFPVLIVAIFAFVLLVIFKIFHTQWWIPTRLQKLMGMQGIRGPSYKLVHGNAKEIKKMKMEAMGGTKGLSHEIFPIVQPQYHSWVKKYGKIFLQWLGTQAQLVVMEPELCKEILINKDKVFMQRQHEGIGKMLIGNGLGTSEGEQWLKHRKLANHALHGERLKNMVPEIVASAEKMMQRLEDSEGKEIEVYNEFRLFTAEVISRTAFGSSYLEGKKIFDMLTQMCVLVFRNSYKIRLPGIRNLFRTNDEIEAEKVENEIRDEILKIIKRRENEAVMKKQDEHKFGEDLLGSLLKAHHEDKNKSGYRVTIDDIIDQCKALYFAGQETTNGSLAWNIFLLALHQDWQEEARKEVLQVFGDQNPTPDGLSKLKTMNMIINETLRLYPPVIELVKKTPRQVKLGKLTIPANTELVIPIVALHHDTEIWGEDADLFKPERFSEGISKATKDNMAAFIPFGLGPRTCVGFNFATHEIKIALSMILQRYSVTLSPGYVHYPLQYLTLRPPNGVQVFLHSL